MSKPRVIVKPNPALHNLAELIEALKEQTAATNQLVGMVGALLAEREQQAEETPVQRYTDGSPRNI